MEVIKGLKKIIKEDLISFHVPGHKGRGLLPEFMRDIQKIDITEIPGSDNLHFPQGIILKAQKKAAKIFGAHRTYFLVNGTTVGIQAMILSVCKPGDKLLVPRNCHRSVWSALIIGDIKPIYIDPEIHPITGIGLSISPEAILEKIREHPDIKAAIITYPTYYGTCCDIEKISKILHNESKLLLVDEAHGPHLSLHRELPKTALEGGADIVVQSTHKILSSFTQSSMLHVGSNNISLERIEMFLGLLQSSSPSYLLITSLDFAAQQAKAQGYEKWDNILNWNQQAYNQINESTSMIPLGKDFIGKYGVVDFDASKLLIDVSPIGLRGVDVEKILRNEYKIQIELSDYYHILAMTGMGTEKEDISKLSKALIEISNRWKGEDSLPIVPINRIKEKCILSPREAVYESDQEVALENAEGRISKEFIIPYPPGIPMVLPGELITREIIEGIKELKGWGGQIIGPQDHKLKKLKVVRM